MHSALISSHVTHTLHLSSIPQQRLDEVKRWSTTKAILVGAWWRDGWKGAGETLSISASGLSGDKSPPSSLLSSRKNPCRKFPKLDHSFPAVLGDLRPRHINTIWFWFDTAHCSKRSKLRRIRASQQYPMLMLVVMKFQKTFSGTVLFSY